MAFIQKKFLTHIFHVIVTIACAIVCSEDFVKKHNLQNQAIEIVGQSMTTDSPKLFNERSAIEVGNKELNQ